MIRPALVLAACALLACGYYGPPVRGGAPAPAPPEPAPALDCPDPAGDCETPSR